MRSGSSFPPSMTIHALPAHEPLQQAPANTSSRRLSALILFLCNFATLIALLNSFLSRPRSLTHAPPLILLAQRPPQLQVSITPAPWLPSPVRHLRLPARRSPSLRLPKLRSTACTPTHRRSLMPPKMQTRREASSRKSRGASTVRRAATQETNRRCRRIRNTNKKLVGCNISSAAQYMTDAPG